MSRSNLEESKTPTPNDETPTPGQGKSQAEDEEKQIWICISKKTDMEIVREAFKQYLEQEKKYEQENKNQ